MNNSKLLGIGNYVFFVSHFEGSFVWNYGQSIANGEAEEEENIVTSDSITKYEDISWDKTFSWSKVLTEFKNDNVEGEIALLDGTKCSINYNGNMQDSFK